MSWEGLGMSQRRSGNELGRSGRAREGLGMSQRRAGNELGRSGRAREGLGMGQEALGMSRRRSGNEATYCWFISHLLISTLLLIYT